MNSKIIIDSLQISLIIKRLAYQIVEDNPDLANTAFIGIQPRGTWFSKRLVEEVNKVYGKEATFGLLDITFYRDDVRQGILVPNKTEIFFSLEGRNVVLIDDVLYTGRTTRAALDALLDFGRPARVELCVLIDRRFTREFPIAADYVGLTIDTILSQKVKVLWQENDAKDEVVLVG